MIGLGAGFKAAAGGGGGGAGDALREVGNKDVLGEGLRGLPLARTHALAWEEQPRPTRWRPLMVLLLLEH